MLSSHKEVVENQPVTHLLFWWHINVVVFANLVAHMALEWAVSLTVLLTAHTHLCIPPHHLSRPPKHPTLDLASHRELSGNIHLSLSLGKSHEMKSHVDRGHYVTGNSGKSDQGGPLLANTRSEKKLTGWLLAWFSGQWLAWKP